MTPQSPVLPSALIDLPEVIYGRDQPEYAKLPTLVSRDSIKLTTSRWQMTWAERLRVLFTGQLWIQQATFSMPYQPIKPTTIEPSIEDCFGQH